MLSALSRNAPRSTCVSVNFHESKNANSAESSRPSLVDNNLQLFFFDATFPGNRADLGFPRAIYFQQFELDKLCAQDTSPDLSRRKVTMYKEIREYKDKLARVIFE